MTMITAVFYIAINYHQQPMPLRYLFTFMLKDDIRSVSPATETNSDGLCDQRTNHWLKIILYGG